MGMSELSMLWIVRIPLPRRTAVIFLGFFWDFFFCFLLFFCLKWAYLTVGRSEGFSRLDRRVVFFWEFFAIKNVQNLGRGLFFFFFWPCWGRGLSEFKVFVFVFVFIFIFFFWFFRPRVCLVFLGRGRPLTNLEWRAHYWLFRAADWCMHSPRETNLNPLLALIATD